MIGSPMIVLGLTGSIGMGKSTAARMLRGMGVPVHESDAAVHELLAPGGRAVAAVRQAFPKVENEQGGIDRAALGRIVFNDAARRKALESILHPMVVQAQRDFLKSHARRGTRLAVLDIPLLFETGADRRVDYTVVVTAPAFVQRARVLARGLTEDQFHARLATQLPDIEKRKRADFIVQTGRGMSHTRRELRQIVHKLTR